jgi:hypothetical protein
MKKRKIINIVLIVFIVIGIFLVIKFDLVGKIENKVNKKKIKNEASAKTDESGLITETFIDKDGNEIEVEMRKIVIKDEETGEEVIMYEDTAEPKVIRDYMYKGIIEKIEDNKVYLTVDKESKNGSYFCEEVSDYQIIYNLSSYKTEVDTSVEYFVCEHITLDFKDFGGIEDLENLVGKYIRVQDSKYEDYYNGEEYKVLNFFAE